MSVFEEVTMLRWICLAAATACGVVLLSSTSHAEKLSDRDVLLGACIDAVTKKLDAMQVPGQAGVMITFRYCGCIDQMMADEHQSMEASVKLCSVELRDNLRVIGY
jgi:hypothetical protein